LQGCTQPRDCTRNERLPEIVTKQDNRAVQQRTLAPSISEQMNTVFWT
jgi:hypothetical protein